MKPKTIQSILAAALLAPGALFAQTTATTTPVGYITHTIATGTGFLPNGSTTLISPTLIQPAAYSASTTVTPTGGDVATFAGGVPVGLDGSYVLEIKSGTGEGWWSTVVSSNATSVTVADDFPADLPPNTTISIRKHTTLLSFLGFNTPGFVTFNGLDASDEIQILDPVNQQSVAYAFVTADDLGDPEYPNGSWVRVDSTAPSNDVVISPGSCVLVKRIGTSALTFTSSGEVKTNKTEVDIYPGFNYLGTMQAASGTFGNSGLASQLNLWDGIGLDYDELQVVLQDQSTVAYAAIDDGGPIMYSITGDAPAADEVLNGGIGMFLKRTGNPASTITLTGSTVAP